MGCRLPAYQFFPAPSQFLLLSRRVPGRQDNPIADANSMPSTADSQSFVVQSTADSEAASHGDLNPAAAGSLYPNKKMKKEEVEKEEEVDETKPCECCRKLETTKLEHMPGDEYYECNVEEYRDEHEMLRLIYYLRSVDESGGFYVECPPPGFFGGIYNRAHFPCMNFNEKAEISARRAINEYNEKKTKKLEFVRMINATGSPAGHYTIFYLTFEAVDTAEMGLKNTYQAVVCYDLWQQAVDEVSVFRSESNGEDLLEPDSSFDEMTMPKWRRKPKNSGVGV